MEIPQIGLSLHAFPGIARKPIGSAKMDFRGSNPLMTIHDVKTIAADLGARVEENGFWTCVYAPEGSKWDYFSMRRSTFSCGDHLKLHFPVEQRDVRTVKAAFLAGVIRR